MPFNRAERTWAYRAAKKEDTTIAFGSTRALDTEGDAIFFKQRFTTLDHDADDAVSITIGEDACVTPYTTKSIINISGMIL